MARAHLSLLLVAAVAVGCSSAKPVKGPHSNSMLITEAEIVESRGSSALDVIQKRRANFLTYRGETSGSRARSSPYPMVYLDGQLFGRIEMLKTIPAMQIASIRLYRSWEATTKFGVGNMGGVIEIVTRQ